MIINYAITGAGFLCLAIAGFLYSLGMGFLILGFSLVAFGLVLDMERL
jgi:hypothetical protein